MVNGNSYDWESVEIMLPSGLAVAVTDISYDDERPIEERYGRGSLPHGYGRGNYKASGKMTLDLEEATRLQLSLGGSVYDSPPFPIIVCYGTDGLPIITDTLPLVKIVKTSSGAKQGEANVGVREYDFTCIAPIVWGFVPALLPT